MKADSYLDLARVLLTKPGAMKSYDRIFLLSHMRANTSLLGHIIGDNPEVNGYYEMHIGYYSWRSMLRQNYRFFRQHPPKKNSRYLFDKILHNDHEVNLKLFPRGKILFALREPEKTIPSIVSLYATRIDKTDPCATVEGAAEYYLGRLEGLRQLADSFQGSYCYVDADAIRENPSSSLNTLSQFLDLATPLREEYQTQPLTGAQRAGDSSADIHSGKIRRVATNRPGAPIDDGLLRELQSTYHAVRRSLLENPACASRITLPEQVNSG